MLLPEGFVIEGPEEIAEVVQRLGFLPFFRNPMAGFSLEEMIPPEFWFPDEGEGVWEWKGPVISRSGCAYGKFFRGKACFISREWFADFANWRRARAITADEEWILGTLRAEDSMLSRELKAACGYMDRRRGALSLATGERGPSEDPPWARGGKAIRREGFDTAVTRLQMACRIVIADFEYLHDRKGRPYGWGLARYTTPESLFGSGFAEVGRTPEESRLRVLSRIVSLLPDADPAAVEKLIS